MREESSKPLDIALATRRSDTTFCSSAVWEVSFADLNPKSLDTTDRARAEAVITHIRIDQPKFTCKEAKIVAVSAMDAYHNMPNGLCIMGK